MELIELKYISNNEFHAQLRQTPGQHMNQDNYVAWMADFAATVTLVQHQLASSLKIIDRW